MEQGMTQQMNQMGEHAVTSSQQESLKLCVCGGPTWVSESGPRCLRCEAVSRQQAGTRAVLHSLAEKAATAAGHNARVAPELLYAHILWTLEDAQEKGVLTVQQVGQASGHGE
jgi:hypothetical protein